MARTYCLFIGNDEVFRGTLADCGNYLDEECMYQNDIDYHIVIMLPHGRRLSTMTDYARDRINKTMSFEDRLRFSQELNSGKYHL